jgi:hypothetical protein
LSFRDQLRDSIRKDEKQGKPGTWHSKAYHRFFEGYSEVSVPKPDGKGYRIQRIYTGDLYRQDLTKGRRFMLRGLYAVLFLCIMYLFVSAAILPLDSNSTWYVVLPQVASIPFLFWILIIFLSYLPASQDMTVDGYRSSSQALKKATLGSAICLAIAALVSLLFMVLNQPDEPLPEFFCVARYLAGGLLALFMNRLETRVNYVVIPGKKDPPVSGNGSDGSVAG